MLVVEVYLLILLYVEGAITAPEGTLRDDGGGWVRTYGNTGWYSQTHAGGWYMTDSTWIRSYNSKNVYVNTLLRADGGIASGDLSPGAGNIAATGTITAGKVNMGHEQVKAVCSVCTSKRVDCSAGKTVIGGGCSGGTAFKVNAPVSDGSGWQCNNVFVSSISAYAICANIG